MEEVEDWSEAPFPVAGVSCRDPGVVCLLPGVGCLERLGNGFRPTITALIQH